MPDFLGDSALEYEVMYLKKVLLGFFIESTAHLQIRSRKHSGISHLDVAAI